MVLVVATWMPESIQMVYLLRQFLTLGKNQSGMVPDPMNKMDEKSAQRFYEPVFLLGDT